MRLKFPISERKNRSGHIDFKQKKSIWIHAASVGEVNAIKTLLKSMLSEFPQKIILTTMTKTGQKIARTIDKHLIVTYIPFDLFHWMKRFYQSISPQLIILVETEFWPNMLQLAKKKNIPVLLINGRISSKSFPIYQRTSFFWKPLLSAIIRTNAQSEVDRVRLIGLGLKSVQNAHNLKFSLELPQFDRKKIRNDLKIAPTDFLLVWGSSRPGEEAILKSILSQLKKDISNLKIIIAPRHLERVAYIRKLFENSCLHSSGQEKPEDILIIDELGILTKMYAASDLVIIGGSFTDFGGHNPLEAVYYSIPTIIGNFHSSCYDSVNKLLNNSGIITSSAECLLKDILNLYKNKRLRQELGENGKRTLQENSISLELNLKTIRETLEEEK